MIFCEQCGTPIDDNLRNCSACGAPVSAATVHAHKAARPTAPDIGSADTDYNLTGWSPHIDNPAILKRAREFNRHTIIMGFIYLAGYLIALGTYGYFDDGGENLYPLLGVALTLGGGTLIWCFNIVLHRAGRSWDGVVEEKKIIEKRIKYRGGKSKTKTIHQVIIRKENGGRFILHDNQIVRYDHYIKSPFIYEDYAPGDRVRYHKFIAYTEKYDKRGSAIIICAVCGLDNSPKIDRCTHCNEPLLKGAVRQ